MNFKRPLPVSYTHLDVYKRQAAGKAGYEPITIFILEPGSLFVQAALSALQNKFKIGAAKRGIDPSNPDCGGSCAEMCIRDRSLTALPA